MHGPGFPYDGMLRLQDTMVQISTKLDRLVSHSVQLDENQRALEREMRGVKEKVEGLQESYGRQEQYQKDMEARQGQQQRAIDSRLDELPEIKARIDLLCEVCTEGEGE